MQDEPFGVRVGMFFLVLGFGAFILFVISDLARKPDFDYLFVAMLLIGIGWGMRRRKAPSPPAGRFSMFRRGRDKDNKRK